MSLLKVALYLGLWMIAAGMFWAILHGGSKLNPHDSDDWPTGGAA